MRAKTLFVMILGLLFLDASAQISGDHGFAKTDSSSITSIIPLSFRIGAPVGIYRLLVHPPKSPLMDANMTVQHLPFFCRQEFRFEKVSGIPLRMRLGSMQQTDWLEQKAHTAAPW